MLQPYTFTVQHRKGSQNTNADALSCLPLNYPHFMLEKGGENVTGECAEELMTMEKHANYYMRQLEILAIDIYKSYKVRIYHQ